ncbi:YqzE family protein [Bacillus massilinigeriensis]|uniref:YqzE family protein n=1 Tax=Bacillus massilionigeriensis TaxID=1805475 RepID=UPI00096B19A3|nr:YqzE family protein [Bacillus massilionigeriensis]
MKTNDYVKYITQTFVQYMDQPKETRKKARVERKAAKETFLMKWFGIIPFVIIEAIKRRK